MAGKKEIIQQLADKYHLPKSTIEEVVNSQFKFAVTKMADDSLPSIRIPFFGIFKPDSPAR